LTTDSNPIRLPARLRPDRWLVGGCLLALLLLFATALNYANTRRQQDNAQRVAHTHQVIDALTATTAHLRAAEASQRSYLITAERSDMAPFETEVTAALAAVDAAGDLTADNPRQQAQSEEVRREIQELASSWRETAMARQLQGAEEARRRLLGRRSSDLLARVSGRLAAMSEIERGLLDERARGSLTAYETAIATGLVTGIASLVLVVSFALLLKRHLSRGLADARALRQLSAELREADRRKDRFLATLAHELRNPLAPVRNAAAILASPRFDPARLAWASEVIQRQVGHMAALLDDLLDVARITQGKLKLRRERVSLSAVVQTAVEAARPIVSRKSQDLEVRMGAGHPTLDVDPVRLAQALSNLLTNAAKYTNPGGRILLCADAREADLTLLVRDNGIGIEPGALPHVFEMFNQVEAGEGRAEGGLGIGLALTRGVVELHGGTITARSDGPNKGSEFTIVLLRAIVAPVPPQAGPLPTPAQTTGKAHRILVADDNRDAAESLAVLLQMEGHEARVVDGGKAALLAATEFEPDMAFLDIGMPDMDGYAVARALRASATGRDLVLVAVTGWGQAEDRRRSAEAGFDAHLTKPVEPGKLDALLSQPLGELGKARRAISELTDAG
jgi:signal transduction histidine kinase/ActR/RegA family two-component response regulator